MKRLSVLLLVLVSAGCSPLPFHGEGENEAHDRVPMICSPEHAQLPCTDGVAVGRAYPFNLLTHCGIEWAYFDGRYWVPKPKVDPPSDWAGIEDGTIVMERPAVAAFQAAKGGGARFVPASASYHPPTCA